MKRPKTTHTYSLPLLALFAARWQLKVRRDEQLRLNLKEPPKKSTPEP